MSLSEQWCLATGEDEGNALIYRIRLNAPTFAHKSDFHYLLLFLWAYDAPSCQGMPSNEDAERMTDLENLIQPAIEDAGQGFLAAIVTGNGIREWQWYVRQPDAILALVNKALGHLETYPIEISFQDDPDWSIYGQFLDFTGSVQGGL